MSRCAGPASDWQICFDCPFDDCICDVVTRQERKAARALDALASRLTGYKTEDQKARAKRYQENKEQSKRYYADHKQDRLEYYRKNRERLKAQALKRYYEKVKAFT